jgi:hypothetical protein
MQQGDMGFHGFSAFAYLLLIPALYFLFHVK